MARGAGRAQQRQVAGEVGERGEQRWELGLLEVRISSSVSVIGSIAVTNGLDVKAVSLTAANVISCAPGASSGFLPPQGALFWPLLLL